jgi:hypothetical protein
MKNNQEVFRKKLLDTGVFKIFTIKNRTDMFFTISVIETKMKLWKITGMD